MMNKENLPIYTKIQEAAAKKVLFLPHAIRQMSRPERMVTASEVKQVIENGDIIEEYPEDKRGYSCLILGYGYNNRPIHVVCSPKDDYLAIITVYIPNDDVWDKKFRLRRVK